MRTIFNLVANCCYLLISGAISSVSHGNNDPCMIRHVFNDASGDLFIAWKDWILEVTIDYQVTGYFLFLAVLAPNSTRFIGFCKFFRYVKFLEEALPDLFL